MRLGDLAERRADVALAAVGAHRFRQHAHAGLELGRDLVEHRLHDGRHAGHHDDIAEPEAGRGRDFVVNEIGAGRDARHAHARLVHLAAGLRQPLAQDLDRARIVVDRHAERLGDAFGGDVVMGRTDAAGGEHIGVARAQRVERGDDLALLVADDAHFRQVDAERGQVFGDVADVLVLGPPGEDLVPDHQQGGGDQAGMRSIGSRHVRPCVRFLTLRSRTCAGAIRLQVMRDPGQSSARTAATPIRKAAFRRQLRQRRSATREPSE